MHGYLGKRSHGDYRDTKGKVPQRSLLLAKNRSYLNLEAQGYGVGWELQLCKWKIHIFPIFIKIYIPPHSDKLRRVLSFDDQRWNIQ